MLGSFQNTWLKHSMIFVGGLLTGALVVGFMVLSPSQANSAHPQLLNALEQDALEIRDLKQFSEHTFQNVVRRIGGMQARIVAMEAHIAKMADHLGATLSDLEPENFSVSYHLNEELADINLFSALASLEYKVLQHSQQVNALDDVASARHLQELTQPRGRSHHIVKGWISSYFGSRTDPLTGAKKWHSGVDIGTAPGSEVKCVASGVVLFAGEKGGYGNLLEVSHGDGLVTRYGHNQKLLVKAGDIVHKGTVIALAGQSGRATGPHVHFEVREDGRAVDPSKYIPDMVRKA